MGEAARARALLLRLCTQRCDSARRVAVLASRAWSLWWPDVRPSDGSDADAPMDEVAGRGSGRSGRPKPFAGSTIARGLQ